MKILERVPNIFLRNLDTMPILFVKNYYRAQPTSKFMKYAAMRAVVW